MFVLFYCGVLYERLSSSYQDQSYGVSIIRGILLVFSASFLWAVYRYLFTSLACMGLTIVMLHPSTMTRDMLFFS